MSTVYHFILAFGLNQMPVAPFISELSNSPDPFAAAREWEMAVGGYGVFKYFINNNRYSWLKS